jgi:lysozyme
VTTPFLAHDIAREEGRVATAYPDPLSPLGRACAREGLSPARWAAVPEAADLCGAPWTIGVGHTGPEVRRGLAWTDAQIDAALAADLARATDALDRRLPWWRRLCDERQDVLVQMAFQMGADRLLGFRQALAALREGAFDAAADAVLDSAWARTQTPRRAARLAQQLRTGARAG